jgi:hypothetical protein
MIESARRTRKWRLLAMVVAVVAIALVWRELRVSAMAEIGAGYAAQQTCACIFISGRELESCRAELDPLARWLVSVRPTRAEVTASTLGIAHATARYDKNFGCTLED